MTDSNTAIQAAQAGLQGLADTLGQRDAALAAASVQLQLTSDALTDARAQVATLSTANAAQQATIDALKAQLAALQAQNDQLTTPAGYTAINVDKSGAVDVTAAIQTELDKGGKRYLPAGRYLVDPTRLSLSSTRLETTAFKLANGADILMHADSVLVSKPHNRARAYIFYGKGLTGVLLQGGQLLGERTRHTMSGAGTDEWVHGLALRGCQAIVRDMRITQFFGDGISAAGDIVLERVVSRQNRRQGLSIAGPCTRFETHDCEFCETGNVTVDGVLYQGTAPMSGIDVEPDSGVVANVRIVGGKVQNNSRVGVLLYTRSGTGSSINGVEIRDVDIAGNTNGIEAGAAAGPVGGVLVAGCNIHDNKYAGSKWGKNTAATVGGPNGDANTFKGNGYVPVQTVAGSSVTVLENVTG